MRLEETGEEKKRKMVLNRKRLLRTPRVVTENIARIVEGRKQECQRALSWRVATKSMTEKPRASDL